MFGDFNFSTQSLVRRDYESSVIDRGRGMGWATALGARQLHSFTHHIYKRFGMRIRAENCLRFQLIRADIDGQAKFS